MKKNIVALFGGLILGLPIMAQQTPTVAGLVDPNSATYWSRSGNNNVFSQNNMFGTLWNSPIYTQTNAQLRMKLNGDFAGLSQYFLNGFGAASGVNTSGYLLLGQNLPLQTTHTSIYTAKGAFSLLHLNGAGNEIQELGYRPWMQTGITFTGNNDLTYIGLRPITAGIGDRTETVIAWTDNQTNIADELVFRFIGQSIGGSGMVNPGTNFASPDDIDGLHIARFTPLGRMGLGNTFGHIDDPEAVGYNTPRSLLHLSYQFRAGDQFEPYGFMQITYRPAPIGATLIGQGESANDGLRLGIDNTAIASGGATYLNSYLRWQEQSSFIIQTESTTDNNINNDERMRITSIGALNENFGSNYLGNIGPGNESRTRIGISANGALPVQRPMSLLHLGFDAPSSSGWRNWMDIGSYMTNGFDNMYVGMMRISEDAQNDRYDAVINWGDNLTNSPGPFNGPDNLRFVFTSNASGTGPAVGTYGLEGARMTPSVNGVLTGFGGTAGTNPYVGGGENATATVEINGWGTASNVNGGNSGLRFTDLNTSSIPIANPGNGFLSVNANGDVVYVNTSAIMGATCGATPAEGKLSANTRLNLSNNNYYFDNETTPHNQQYNRVSVGYSCTITDLPARFNVMERLPYNTSINTTSSHAQNLDLGTSIGMYFIGMRGLSNGVQTVTRITNNGGYFTGANSEINYGVRGQAYRGTYTLSEGLSYGGYFTADDNTKAYGVRVQSTNLTTSGVSYGIHAGADGGAVTRAGYFDGIVQASSFVVTSDSIFKTNVSNMNGSLQRIIRLRPVSYDMDQAGFPQMSFDDQLQFGFIAQEVEQLFPNLVYDSYHPSEIDSLGNPIDSSVTYKSLNYNGLIPLNTQAIIELNQKVDKITLSDETIKTNVQDLDSSLNKVLAMRGVSYDWVHTVHPELNLDSSNHVGFIAQEIQQIDPRLTYVADDSLLHVEYDKVVPILAEAIQELNNEVETKDSLINVLMTENTSQQGTIEDLNARLTQLENCLSGILPYLCQLSQSPVQANTPTAQEEVRKNLNVTLSRRSILLDQNVPNPFAEQTVINFSIPSTVVKAQIHFYDGNGKLIQSVDVAERGAGSITVFGSDLSKGTYTYTLVADGQIVATKKMIKQ